MELNPKLPVQQRSLSDSHGRNFEYLRLSVTDLCNFKCTYCLPNGYQKQEGEKAMGLDEIRNLASGFAAMGFWKVRLTGGEPTVRADIVEIARAVARTPGIRKVALSTNGYRLESLVPELSDAGVTALNVSLDSLNEERFRQITGSGNFRRVVRGIERAVEAGFDSVKVNVVLLRGMNDGDVESFMDWTRELPVSVRFIELMRTGKNRVLFERCHISGGELQLRLLRSGWSPVERAPGDGPALEYCHPGHRGRIGIIAPYSRDFCSSCNRLRVSSTGKLRLCLFGDGDTTLRPWIQREDQRDELVARVHALIGAKPVSHFLHEGKYGQTRNLSAIGG